MFKYLDQLTSIIDKCAGKGNAGNITAIIKGVNPTLLDAIVDFTKFLDTRTTQDASVSERIYCILNNITEIKTDAFGKPARFINSKRGYSLKETSGNLMKRNAEILSIVTTELYDESKYKDVKRVKDYLIYSYKRNEHLYQPDAILGYDYVVCPHSGVRLMMIKGMYIRNVLKMTVEEYDTMYPDIQKIAKRGAENIKNGLSQIDEETGLTKHAISTISARVTLSTIDPVTGLSGYQMKGQKTRATHLSNIDEHGNNGYSQLASRAIIVGNQTKVDRGLILPPESKNDLYRYRMVVLYLTNRYKEELVHGYKTGLAGTRDAWQIDHIYSVQQGLMNGVSPLVIGHRENLRMLEWHKNVKKRSKCDITLGELYERCSYTPEKSKIEFDFVMQCIHEDAANNISPNGAYVMERLYEARASGLIGGYNV